MAITSLTTQQLDPRAFLIEFTSGLSDPTFYIYRDGVLVETTTETSFQVFLSPSETFRIEVFDDIGDVPGVGHSGHLLMTWRGVSESDHYLVQHFVDAAWVTVSRVQEIAQSVYVFESSFLDDMTTHQFQILAVGTDGNESDPLSFSGLVVRRPDRPRVIWDWDSGTGTLTATEDT